MVDRSLALVAKAHIITRYKAAVGFFFIRILYALFSLSTSIAGGGYGISYLSEQCVVCTAACHSGLAFKSMPYV